MCVFREQLARSFMNILDCFFEPFYEHEARDPPTNEEIAALANDIPQLLIFALTWSVAGTTNRYVRDITQAMA